MAGLLAPLDLNPTAEGTPAVHQNRSRPPPLKPQLSFFLSPSLSSLSPSSLSHPTTAAAELGGGAMVRAPAQGGGSRRRCPAPLAGAACRFCWCAAPSSAARRRPKTPGSGLNPHREVRGRTRSGQWPNFRRWLAPGRAGGKPWRQKNEAAQGQAHEHALVHEDGGRGRVNSDHKSPKVKLLHLIS